MGELDITDFDNVEAALYGMDDALNFVSKQRSNMGALQNRLESTMNSLEILRKKPVVVVHVLWMLTLLQKLLS